MNNDDMKELEEQFRKLLSEQKLIRVEDIPDIDLYMDQVTTFMDQHLAASTRKPETDKILTKTMINNYAKNNLLIPPVNKKYGKDHMVLLILIYYLKSFLSINDIAALLKPLQANCTQIGRQRRDEEKRKTERREKRSSPEERKAAEGGQGSTQEPAPELQAIYEKIAEEMEVQLRKLGEETKGDFEAAAADFEEYPAESRRELQRFDLICRLGLEIYVRKLFIERLIDQDQKDKGEDL